jgi:pimeloyl-[acyl-carrier protein] synthase
VALKTLDDTQELDLDGLFASLFSQDALQDPCPLFRRYHGPGVKHSFALKVLHDHRFRQRTMEESDHAMWNSFRHWLISLDGVDHTRMRALAARPFARHLMDAYATSIDSVIQSLLDSIEASTDPIDLMPAYAYVVPITVICTLLGVPAQDRLGLDASLRAVSIAFERQQDPECLNAGDRAIDELTAYFEPLVYERRHRPGDDLLSALASADDVPSETVLANAIFLMIAGHETTTAAIGASTMLLLEHPDQMALVRERPGLAASAIEETLRYHTPVQITERTASVEAQVEDFRFEPGDCVPIFLGAVNRDPSVFVEPDRFDITRDPNPHLAFTAGPHFCLGAPLARLDAPMAVAALLERFPSLRLADEPKWRGAFPLRLLGELPVTW